MSKKIFILFAVILILTVTVFAACGEAAKEDKADSGASNEDISETAAKIEPVTEEITEAPTEKPTVDPALLPVEGKVKVTKWYPSSSLSEGLAAPENGKLLIGDLIGAEGGWEGNPDTGNAAAFDGDTGTFFDPAAASNVNEYCGLKTDVPYILTEIRIYPREAFPDRFKGAAIWGSNEETFATSTATKIWVSGAEAEEIEFQVITADQFIEGTNTGFTHFIYFNQATHGDVAEVELYGNPAN
jgi:outer membrane murein-binding lipoprotein Lpp